MADDILDPLRDIVESQIDFEGQKLSENLSNALLLSTGIASFVTGYTLQDIRLTLFVAIGGLLATMLAVVPAWPFFNSHPIRWLPAQKPQFDINIST